MVLSGEQIHFNVPEDRDMWPTFNVVICKTYFAQGFFNVSVDFARYFDKHGSAIQINCTSMPDPIVGKINRTVNSTDAPRILGGVALRGWLKSSLREGDALRVEIQDKTHINFKPS